MELPKGKTGTPRPIVRCPRCGIQHYTPLKYTARPDAKYPALSRQEDTDICDACGIHEAMLDFAGTPAWDASAWKGRDLANADIFRIGEQEQQHEWEKRDAR